MGLSSGFCFALFDFSNLARLPLCLATIIFVVIPIVRHRQRIFTGNGIDGAALWVAVKGDDMLEQCHTTFNVVLAFSALAVLGANAPALGNRFVAFICGPSKPS